MANSAAFLNTNTLSQYVVQDSHGFTVGEVLSLTSDGYVPSEANALSTSQIVGMVSYVEDVNTFYLTQSGYVSGLGSLDLTAGTTYYLDPANAGGLTATAPIESGQYVVQLFIADSTSSGFFAVSPPLPSNPDSFSWSVITGNTNLLVNHGYIVNGTVSLALPSTFVAGDQIRIVGYSGGWTVTQGASQQINVGNISTTSGTGGSLASSNKGDCLDLIGCIANTHLAGIIQAGNLIVV